MWQTTPVRQTVTYPTAGISAILHQSAISMLRLSLFLSIFTLLMHQATGQIRAPKYVNEFLAIGVGARGLAMSNTMASVAEDATAGYWNPAGLLGVQDKYAFSAMHASYFGGIANYDFAAFATPVDTRSHIGISLIRFAVDDIPDTRYLFSADGAINYENVRSFSAADYALLFSYARRFPKLKDIRFGASFKLIHRNVGRFANAWGFGLDAGAQWISENKKWNAGLVMRDVTGTYNSWTFNTASFADVFVQTGNTIPDNSIEVALPRLTAAGGRNLRLIKSPVPDLYDETLGLLLTAGMDVTLDGARNTLVRTGVASVDPRAGMELHFRRKLFLRGGVGNFQRIKTFNGAYTNTVQPNFGLGFRVRFLSIDYALTDITDRADALYSHVFSLNLEIGRSPNTKPRY